jgi:hypothetical protein
MVAAIMARKSFLNLARQRAMLPAHPPKTDKALWAVMGVVGESSELRRDTDAETVFVNLRAEAFFAPSCTAERLKGYDYLTVSAKTTLPRVPSSFKGVSGGGLWQVPLSMKAGTILWSNVLHFHGVAFWERPEMPDRVSIRCHGPRSLFERAWKAWKLGVGKKGKGSAGRKGKR